VWIDVQLERDVVLAERLDHEQAVHADQTGQVSTSGKATHGDLVWRNAPFACAAADKPHTSTGV
jgi:hypothetical protein